MADGLRRALLLSAVFLAPFIHARTTSADTAPRPAGDKVLGGQNVAPGSATLATNNVSIASGLGSDVVAMSLPLSVVEARPTGSLSQPRLARHEVVPGQFVQPGAAEIGAMPVWRRPADSGSASLVGTSRTIRMARLTNPAPLSRLARQQVVRGQWVARVAVGAGSVDRRHAGGAQRVLPLGYGPTVERVDAATAPIVAREVIEHQTGWDRTNLALVPPSVNQDTPPCDVGLSVPVVIPGAGPDVATVGLDSPAQRSLCASPRDEIQRVFHASKITHVAGGAYV